MAADALLNAGCIDEAVQFIEHGENIQKETHETLEAAQLLRLSGRCSEIDREPAAAESKYREAVLIASRQGAWLYALRAATAFASLCESQGRCDDARLVLDPIYKTFSEGFDFPDVRRATEILGRLA
jgi:hypothetical protein